MTDFFRKLRVSVSSRFRNVVSENGERAMDNLVGTMLGVLFLAMISASFAGIFMAYTVSSSKAAENSERINLVTKHSTNTLNNLYVEADLGKANGIANGWNIVRHKQKLSTGTPSLGTISVVAFRDYTFAASRPLVTGGTTPVSQWGYVNTSTGLVELYTSVAKAGVPGKCDWTTSIADLNNRCLTVRDSIPSVVAPPTSAKDAPAVDWNCEINLSISRFLTNEGGTTSFAPLGSKITGADGKVRYTLNPNIDSVMNIKTSKLGTFNSGGKTSLRWVMMVDDLTPGKKVSLEFFEPSTGIVSRQTFVPTLDAGESGKIRRALQGSVPISSGARDVEVYIDTDSPSNPTNTDPVVKINNFVVYEKLTPAQVTTARAGLANCYEEGDTDV